ncbi:hypothetical protein BDF19DRAFT_160795 [Syncephalis fuscata]|nr:hypothetical protein BDF19DRAFT_160795 [Syncephalis fuscata]
MSLCSSDLTQTHTHTNELHTYYLHATSYTLSFFYYLLFNQVVTTFASICVAIISISLSYAYSQRCFYYLIAFLVFSVFFLLLLLLFTSYPLLPIFRERVCVSGVSLPLRYYLYLRG